MEVICLIAVYPILFSILIFWGGSILIQILEKEKLNLGFFKIYKFRFNGMEFQNGYADYLIFDVLGHISKIPLKRKEEKQK